jgi:hypothetical protein
VDGYSQQKSAGARRLIGAAVLFFVFFLPLHFHFFSATAQLSQECSCYHGVRTQTGLTSAPADWAPSFQASIVEIYQPKVFSRSPIYFHAIRAPPSITL